MQENFRKFDHRVQKIQPHIVSLLSAIDEAKGVFRVGININPETVKNIRKSVIVTSTGSSTRIEGSKLNDDEVEKIMKGINFQKFDDRDSQEVQGYLETLENVFTSFLYLEIRESVITSLHKELLKYSSKDDLHRGEYKKKENIVGILSEDGKVSKIIFETTPAWKTGSEMSELIDWTREALDKNRFHPLLIVANFIVEFLKIHPFEDGNGRLSRILTNLLLLKTNYLFAQYVSHEQIIEKRKDEYYLALRSSQVTFSTEYESIETWLNFFLSCIKEQADKAVSFITINQESVLSSKQKEILDFLSNVKEASPIEVSKATMILLPTVRKSLAGLVKLKMIKSIGIGRATRYIKI